MDISRYLSHSANELAPQKSNQEMAPRSLIEETYFRLRDDIVNGQYKPGEKLRLEHLKSIYNVSAGTLREAVALLVSDALVTNQAQRGFRVAPMSLEDLEDLTKSRVLIECAALKDSLEHADDTWESNLISAYHLLCKAEDRLAENPAAAFNTWEMRNREFHAALLCASTSQWLPRLSRLFHQLTERYHRISAVVIRPELKSREQHKRIFDAALARDIDSCVREMEAHIHYSLNAIRDSNALASLESEK